MKHFVVVGFVLQCTLLLRCTSNFDNVNKMNNNAAYEQKFRKAYEYYRYPKDSLKRKALHFIINNLNDQYYYDGVMLRQYEQSILADTGVTVTALINKLDSLSRIFGHKFTKIYDADIITSSYLVRSIDEAFDSWRYPWARKLNFEEFCEYILPYKMGNEKPEYWRQSLQQEFKWVPDSVKENLFKAAASINDHLHWFKISVNFDYPIDMGYRMSRWVATGTCTSATRLVNYPMRALGLPVVTDFAPDWGNRSSGHEWNALILNNRSYPFNAVESNIGFYKITFVGVNRMKYKPPKIFRKMFSIQDSTLSVINNGKEVIPVNLDNKRIKDVTSEYVPVSDVTLTFSDKAEPNQFAFLCIFNNKNWKPVYWGKRAGNDVIFKNMGRDIVYLPAAYKDSTLIPLGNPFILTKEGTITILKPIKNTNVIVEIEKKYPDDESNKIQVGDKYELLYWDNKEWVSIGSQVAKAKILYFKNAPLNALFWIKDQTQGEQERIFTYFNLKKQWW